MGLITLKVRVRDRVKVRVWVWVWVRVRVRIRVRVSVRVEFIISSSGKNFLLGENSSISTYDINVMHEHRHA